ncbi:MAG TPA: carbon starvation CstA family protein, partial [Armatimonadota bacterium]|nr:carbon starvation CstA family protein [Armatimonadota bacterium]
MNVLVLLAVGVGALWLGSHFYGGYVSRRVGLSPDQPTPARQLNDGRDYVPTRTPVVFAHHFSAIAGAGPIVGPTMALIYGFAPSLLWVLLGGVLIGAVHDFTALFASLREGGRSMAQIARRTMGRSGFALFISFTTVMIVLVTAAFLNLTKTALTSVYPLTALGLDPSQTLLRVEMKDGVMVGRIGGVASTSVLIITGLSPLMGYLLYRRRIAT